MKFEGDIIIATDNSGIFVGRYDGTNTYTLPDGQFHSEGQNLYEIVLKSYRG